MSRKITSRLRPGLLALALLATAVGAWAQATIDHNKAMAGNVTPGDAPGYPITLSRPGHYKLMGNLTVPADTKGIVITASNVTLDLNGFTVAGPGSCTRNPSTRVVTCAGNGGTGIDILGNGVSVRDGAVRGFFKGIAASEGETLLRLHVTQNSDSGVSSGTSHFGGLALVDSIVDMNGGHGMVIQHGHVRGSRIAANGGRGFLPATSVTVTDSYVTDNRLTGIAGVAVRNTVLRNNGTNRGAVTSLGGNLDDATPF